MARPVFWGSNVWSAGTQIPGGRRRRRRGPRAGRGERGGPEGWRERSEDTDVKQPRGLAAGARPAAVSTLAGFGRKPKGKLQARGCGGREAPLLRPPPGPGVPRRPPHSPPSNGPAGGGSAVVVGGFGDPVPPPAGPGAPLPKRVQAALWCNALLWQL